MDLKIKYIIIALIIIIYIKIYCDNNSKYIVPINFEKFNDSSTDNNTDNYILTLITTTQECKECDKYIPIWNNLIKKYTSNSLIFFKSMDTPTSIIDYPKIQIKILYGGSLDEYSFRAYVSNLFYNTIKCNIKNKNFKDKYVIFLSTIMNCKKCSNFLPIWTKISKQFSCELLEFKVLAMISKVPSVIYPNIMIEISPYNKLNIDAVDAYVTNLYYNTLKQPIVPE